MRSVWSDGNWLNFSGEETGSRGKKVHYFDDGTRNGQTTNANTVEQHVKNGNAYVVDYSEVIRFFQSLSAKDVDNSINSAWKRCMKIVGDATKANIRSSGLRKSNKLAEAVKSDIKKYHGELAYGYVHILKTPKSPYGRIGKDAGDGLRRKSREWNHENPQFTVRFFETGSKGERFTKDNPTDTYYRNGSIRKRARLRKGHSTGTIRGYGFLKHASEQKMETAMDSFKQELDKVVIDKMKKASKKK